MKTGLRGGARGRGGEEMSMGRRGRGTRKGGGGWRDHRQVLISRN